jgi:hypothetical protein
MYIPDKKWVIPVATGIASFAAGAVVGYIYARRNVEVVETVEYEQIEIDFEEGEALAPEDFTINRQRFVDRYGDSSDHQAESKVLSHVEKIIASGGDPTSADRLVSNVFVDNEDWNWETELANRSTERPYILHVDEYSANENDYRQVSFEYYAGDDILADETRQPIYNYTALVGNDMNFGHGSEDPNIFHVRNDSREAEYEIVYNPGAYAEEVLGIEPGPELDAWYSEG